MTTFASLGLAQENPSPSRGVVMASEVSSPPSSIGYRTRHALVIGIDRYQSPQLSKLGCAVADASAIAKTLIDRFGFDPNRVQLILNEDATKVAIDHALEDWACDTQTVGSDDLFVIFFAGHGLTRSLGARGQRGYLVPVDGQLDSEGQAVWSTMVGMNHLEDVSVAIPAKHALFVLDCCFGGLAVTRSVPPIVAGLNNRARQVITAGGKDQEVLDGGGGGHSVFTGTLLDAWRGEGDLDGDGVMTFGETYMHVGRVVRRATKDRQQPLQANLPDHEGGSIALFSPEGTPLAIPLPDRLKVVERSAQERLEELERLSDALTVRDLIAEMNELWPQAPHMIENYERWLHEAESLLARRGRHQESVRRVRQEAQLTRALDGERREGSEVELSWDDVNPKLRWRYETFQTLLGDLESLAQGRDAIEERLTYAQGLKKLTVDNHLEAWHDVQAGLLKDSRFQGLALRPQVGLIPLGPDRQSGLFEFGDPTTGDVPERDPETGHLRIDETTGVVFVLLPGKTLEIGASMQRESVLFDRAAQDDEQVRDVTLHPFFLSKYEMSQGQWLRFTGHNPSLHAPGSQFGDKTTTLRHPVEQVDWNSCRETLARLGWTLPTEAQWEYAARASTTSAWWTGEKKESLSEAANLSDLFAQRNGGPLGWSFEAWDDGYTVHAPIGLFRPNAFGLHDVAGNVWEWCRDAYSEFPSALTAGEGEYPGKDSRYRVRRGGSFYNPALLARSALRGTGTQSSRLDTVGVRPARRIEP